MPHPFGPSTLPTPLGMLNPAKPSRLAKPGILRHLAASASNDPPARYLDSRQAAEYLGGMNHRVVTKWAREGYLPAYPLGEGKRRLWRFLCSDLDQWMLARRTGTLPPATDAPTQEKHHGW